MKHEHRVCYKLAEDCLQASLFLIGELFFHCLSPLPLKGFLQHLDTGDRVCHWRVKRSAVLKHELGVLRKLFHGRVITVGELGLHGAEIHRMLDFVVVPDRLAALAEFRRGEI
jgi:hypothetical protein